MVLLPVELPKIPSFKKEIKLPILPLPHGSVM